MWMWNPPWKILNGRTQRGFLFSPMSLSFVCIIVFAIGRTRISPLSSSRCTTTAGMHPSLVASVRRNRALKKPTGVFVSAISKVLLMSSFDIGVIPFLLVQVRYTTLLRADVPCESLKGQSSTRLPLESVLIQV